MKKKSKNKKCPYCKGELYKDIVECPRCGYYECYSCYDCGVEFEIGPRGGIGEEI